MKVKCIKNGGFLNLLTVGKTYEVIGKVNYSYEIMNDNGFENWYRIEWFRTLSEIRNEKINKLLE